MTKKDLTGKVFTRLTVQSEADPKVYISPNSGKKTTVRRWVCQCECGNTVTVHQPNLTKKTANTRSCGCLKQEHIDKMKREYGW